MFCDITLLEVHSLTPEFFARNLYTSSFIDLGKKLFFTFSYIFCDLLGHPRSKVNMPNERAYTSSNL